MKKRIVMPLIAALLSLIALCCFFGCGEEENVAGVYRMTRLQYVKDGEIVTVNTVTPVRITDPPWGSPL